MNILLVVFFLFLFFYVLILSAFALGFFIYNNKVEESNNGQVHFTLIICARNEQKTILRCLDSIIKQDYPTENLQLIIVNDASSDKTQQFAENILSKSRLNYTIITNTEQKGKKRSIIEAVKIARNEIIITRDADTYTTSITWLSSLSAHFGLTKCDLLIGPVAISNNAGVFWALQAIENNMLQLITGGSANLKIPLLCSGANLVFTRSIFERTGAYASHLEVASGDDVLFMEEVKKIPSSKISYLKDKSAIVYTYPGYSFAELLKQKVRWASKFTVNKNPLNFFLAISSFMVNLGWIFSLVYGFAQPINNSATLWYVIVKLGFDFLLLFLASGFIRNRGLLWYSLPVGCIYPIYACAVGIGSLFLKPRWK